MVGFVAMNIHDWARPGVLTEFKRVNKVKLKTKCNRDSPERISITDEDSQKINHQANHKNIHQFEGNMEEDDHLAKSFEFTKLGNLE